MTGIQSQRWARVRPALAWKRPGLPTDWVLVLEQHRERSEALLWLDMPGKARHVPEREREFIGPP